MQTIQFSAVCPYCGVTHQEATFKSSETDLIPGTIALCDQCGEISILDENLKHKKPSQAELFKVYMSRHGTEIMATQERYKQVLKDRANKRKGSEND